MKLKRRGIELDTRCPVCYRLDEDGGHCFLKCKSVKALWRAAELEDTRLLLANCPNAKWVMIQILKLNEEICMKVCTLLWTWWLERNRANQGQKIRSLTEILFSHQLHFTEYWEHLKRTKEVRQSKMHVWSPPPLDYLKINSDGAFRESTRSGGWGFTIKNERGDTLVAGAGNLMFVSDPLHAEAAAMFHAIQEAARMGCQKIILETDATVLKQAVTSEAYDNSVLGVLFKDMKSVIKHSFQHCKVQICSRVCNISAHCLAAFGVSQERGNYQVWFDPLPSFVRDLVAGVCPVCVN
jgi:ribonuclease HI